MRVALTGATGFIGSFIARHLARRGHHVTALVRLGGRLEHVRDALDRVVVGDQADPLCWADLLDGADAVVHNSVDWTLVRAARDTDQGLLPHLRSNLDASIHLLAASTPRTFVFISSIGVHHDMRPRWGGMIDEDHPLRPNSLYGAYKAAVEAHLWVDHARTGRCTVAIRPCGVYGIDPRLDRSHGHDIINTLRATRRYAEPGGGKYVHVEDVAAAVIEALERPEVSAGRPFNLVDCYARHGDWAALAAQVLGLDADIDLSSPAAPINTFTKDAAGLLGVPLDRGHDGIRQHLRELVALMDAS